MLKATDKVLLEKLVSAGWLDREAASEASEALWRSSDETSLQGYLLERGLVAEERLLECLARTFRLEVVDLSAQEIPPEVIRRVPVRFASFYHFMPLRIEGRTLLLAAAEPLELKVLDEIRVHLGLEPRLVLARARDVREALNKHYGLAADTVDRLEKEGGVVEDEPAVKKVEDLDDAGDEASITRLVNQILLEAHKQRATDIHIEPYRHKVRVRYRIDGVLVDANVPAAVRRFMSSIVSRIKIMANLSIVEKRIPQDGSAVVRVKEQTLDLRISTIPTPWGESMVIRILPTQVMLLSLEKLGLERENLETFRRLIRKPHGIILVTGPTGSGKTTSLYACLNEINSPERKIITLEDPLEYEMEGITQIQVNPKVNMDFAAGLRSILRHDPDIIMVGEIRDLETAEIAIRTALTGHLVFSTLHTNDAASGVTRLIEMGLEPFLVASSIEAFIAQRLVRIICPRCKEEVRTPLLELREEIAGDLGLTDPSEVRIFHGQGCDACHHTGFYGRTAIYEVLVMNDAIRAAVLDKQRADVIKRLATASGMTTLRQDGWRKVVAGVTTPMEVMNVTARDERPDAVLVRPVGAAVSSSGAPTRERTVPPEVLAAKNEYEGRTYPRLSVETGVRFTILRPDEDDSERMTSDGVEHASVTRDLSAGGLRFICGYALPMGTILDLRVRLPDGGPAVACLGRICRVEENARSGVYDLAVYFLDISSADRARVDRFVRLASEGKDRSDE